MLVSVDELVDYMSGINLSEVQRNAAAMVLSGVQEELETYLNRPLEPVQIRENISTDYLGIGTFSITPVLKIINVSDAEGIGPGGVYIPSPIERDVLVGGEGRVVNSVAPPYITNVGSAVVGVAPRTFSPYSYYSIEYIGGYNGYAISGLKLDIMRVASREVDRNHDDTMSLRGDQAERATPQDERVTGWTLDEKIKWDRYRRRVIV